MNESHEHGLPGEAARDGSDGGRGLRDGSDGGRRLRDGRGVYGRRGQGRWPRPAVAEQLLNGEDVADTDPRTAEMAGLLAAARVLPPGRPQDEAAVLDAFRRAAAAGPAADRAPHAGPVPVVRRRWRAARGPRPVRLLVGGALAVSALGGVAIAAQGGALPHPFHSSDGTTHGPSAPASAAGGTGSSPALPRTPGAASGSASPRALPGTAPRTPGSVSPAPGAPAGAGARGLCEAYAKAEREGTAPAGAVRARLAEAAGSASAIDAYCAALADPAAPTSAHGHGPRSAQPHAGPPSAGSGSAAGSAGAPKASVRITPSTSRHR